MKQIAKVFPRRTTATPDDLDSHTSVVTVFKYDEVHISVTFTWDIGIAESLKEQWSKVCEVVKIGGPAIEGTEIGEFVSGRYLKKGYVITSRGCPNRCRFCLVPEREGKLRELEIVRGNTILDNNLTACSRGHIDKVFEMLRRESGITFSGGLEARKVDDYFIEKLRGLGYLKKLYLAFDNAEDERYLIKTVDKLKRYFKRSRLGCYVLIGWEGNGTETADKAEARLIRAWEIGTVPYVMMYRPPDGTMPSKEIRRLRREWSYIPNIYGKMRIIGK